MVVPAKPGSSNSGLLEIKPGAGTATHKAASKNAAATDQYWLNYYKTHEEEPKDLREKVSLLNVNKKTQDVEGALKGYLTYHSKNAEPWMYEALALAIKMNKGKDSDIQAALGHAADLAEASQNPNYLVSVADLMFIHGYDQRVGKLLDQAMAKIPHRGEPMIMSINLAQRTKDPKRMATSVDRLLSLGWPGIDDQIRRDARQQVETLTKSLRDEGQSEEAETLTQRLNDSETRDLFVRLTWSGDADLDLAVDEPLGATAHYQTPRTVFGGSIVRNGYGKHPEEVYVCPRGFDGKYTIRVETIYNNPEKPALQATIEVFTHEGASDEKKETKTINLSKSPAPFVVTLKGGRRKEVLPFLAPTPIPTPVVASPKKPEATKAQAKTPAAPKAARPDQGKGKPR